MRISHPKMAIISRGVLDMTAMCWLTHTHLRNKTNSIFLPILVTWLIPLLFMNTPAWQPDQLPVLLILHCVKEVLFRDQHIVPYLHLFFWNIPSASLLYWTLPWIHCFSFSLLSWRLSSESPSHPSGIEAHLVSFLPSRSPQAISSPALCDNLCSSEIHATLLHQTFSLPFLSFDEIWIRKFTKWEGKPLLFKSLATRL